MPEPETEAGATRNSDLARQTGRWFLVGLALSAVLSSWLSLNLDNDVHARLAREIAGTPWLTQTNTKPFEQLLARFVGLIPVDPLGLWRALGVVHYALLFALLIRLGGHLLGAAPRPALIAGALVTLASPLLARSFLSLNSVATCAAALVLWLVARAEDRRALSLLALGVLSLSRVDGAVLAGGVAALEFVQLPKDRRREALPYVLVVAAGAATWLVVDRLSNGEWLGILGSTQRYMDAAGSAPRGIGAMLWWLAGAWISNGGKTLALLAFVAVAFGILEDRRAVWQRLAGALAIHHGFLVLLGLTGKPFFYRFFVIDFVFGPLLAVLGILWIVDAVAEHFDRSASPVQQWAAVALALAGSLVPAAGLPLLASEARWTRRETDAAIACLDASGPPRPGEYWAVPPRYHGALTWHYRDAPLADLTWLGDYRARGAPVPARLLRPSAEPAAGERTACTGGAASFVAERIVQTRLPPAGPIR